MSMRIDKFELLVPPPAIGLLIAGMMWPLSSLAPGSAMALVTRVGVALVLTAAGIGISVAGVVAFRRAQTTVNPLRPETSSALVSGGVYGLTRNPMYLGMLLVLIGWAVYLASPWTLLGPFSFVLYMTRFQIIPEERVLKSLFGADYLAYVARIRRWL